MAIQKKRLGEILIDAGCLTTEKLNEALRLQKDEGERLGRVLINNGFVSEKEMLEALHTQMGFSIVDPETIEIPEKIIQMIPYTLVKRYNAIPVKLENGYLTVVMEDPLNFVAIEDIHVATQCEIIPVISSYRSIINTAGRLYGNRSADKAVQDIKNEYSEAVRPTIAADRDAVIDNAPIVRLLNSVIDVAITDGASDIHIEPLISSVRIRYRLDGKLKIIRDVPKDALGALITRIKILSDLDIAERRLPQDGRFDYRFRDNIYNIRVSILPTTNGEKAVLRILDKYNFKIRKEFLGFTSDNFQKFEKLLTLPNGLVLVTGPTGTGKSTTLYAMLTELNKTSENIITIEDPVEYVIEGISQVQVNNKIGLDFAEALRTFLRQDPDVIMVGEIRDSETADIAIRAAITGHLVLSTMHTNDAVSAIARLEEMGIAPYILAVSLMGVISQRLVRKLCPECAIEYDVPDYELKFLGLTGPRKFRKACGCSKCNGIGYKGRMAVHEVLMVDSEIRNKISKGADTNEIAATAARNGMTSLREECIRLLEKGYTSFEEVSYITCGVES
jgi:type IV pilus assembly protein PilB